MRKSSIDERSTLNRRRNSGVKRSDLAPIDRSLSKAKLGQRYKMVRSSMFQKMPIFDSMDTHAMS